MHTLGPRHGASSRTTGAQGAFDDPSRHIELRLAVSSAIEQLSPHDRAAFIMRDVEEWSCAEIAGVLRVGVGGVKTRLHRARLFIRKRLAESLSGRSPGPPVESHERGNRPW